MQTASSKKVGIIGAGRIGQAMALFEEAGFFVVDIGGLRESGRMQQVGAPLAGHNLIRLP
jgi:predicted dinucleotide-binding enzyme